MLPKWEITFSSDNSYSYATDLATGMEVSLNEFFELMVNQGHFTKEIKHEEIFRVKDGIGIVKELKECTVYRT